MDFNVMEMLNSIQSVFAKPEATISESKHVSEY